MKRPRLEDNKGVINVHTNTPSRLKLDATTFEAEEGEAEVEMEDYCEGM